MKNGEEQALSVAKKYVDEITEEEKVKHLATEVVELGMAIAKGDKKNIAEEIGDCAFLLLHIASKNGESGLTNPILRASRKMESRFGSGGRGK